MKRIVSPPQLLVGVSTLALLVAAFSWLTSSSPPGDLLDASAADAQIVAQASRPLGQSAADVASPVPGSDSVALPAPSGAADDAYVLPKPDAATTDDATAAPSDPAAPAAAPADDATPAPAAPAPAPAPAANPAPAPAPSPPPASSPSSNGPAVGQIKSKADEKGYDVHGHVEHSVVLLGQQVLIPGQAATGGFIQTGPNNYLAYSPVTAMLPVAIQDNKEVLQKKPNLQGEQLYRRLAQEYTGSNDYKNLAPDAQRAINILTCTDWSLVRKGVRENTINHLLHSPISFGTIGSPENPISTDVTIDLGYTHTRDKNWTEVEYMGNNVYKVTVVSNNNNGSHTGHEMGTAYVEMPAGTSLREAQQIGNRMIPSTNKNNKLTIDPAARTLFDSLPRGASPMILFEHLSEQEQNAYFKGRGIETVGQPNPGCNPLDGGILGSAPAPAPEPPAEEPPAEEPPAEQPPAEETPAPVPPVEEPPAEETPAPPAETPPAVEPETTPPSVPEESTAPAPPEPSTDTSG